MTPVRPRRLLAVALLLALPVAACGVDEDAAEPTTSATEPTTSTTEPQMLRIVATNDDGVPGPGLATLVAAIEALDGVQVTVVAPATNQTGAGDATTPEDDAATEATLTDGHPATAVAGKPADAVNHALGAMGLEPHLVVSGVNPGQNFGVFSNISGTVGAAMTAARQGVPAVATSSGSPEEFDFEAAAALVVDWIGDHREELFAGTAPTEVVSFNAPACPELRGLLETSIASGMPPDPFTPNCASTKPDTEIVNDVDASLNGFASVAVVPL